MGNHAQMVARHWMTPSLSVSLIFLACLSHTWAGAGPFSWGSRINFAKVAKEKVEEDHRAPRSVWAQHFEDDETTNDYRGRFPRQTARFQPQTRTTRPDLEMLMVMREIEKSILETIDKGEAVPLQESTGTVPRSRVADFRRAFTTLGRL